MQIKQFLHISWKDLTYLLIINGLIWWHFQIKLDQFLREVIYIQSVQAAVLDHFTEPVKTEPVKMVVNKPDLPQPVGLDAKPSAGQVVAAARVCEQHGLSRQCRNDLLAIAYNESRFDCNQLGSSGEKGCFQIMPFHGVAIKQAKDYEWAANWTLERMIRYGYPAKREYAIQCHNGCNANNNYLAVVLRISKAFD